MVCIQSGDICYTVTEALLQTGSRTAYDSGVSDARYIALGLHNVSSSLLNQADISVFCIER
ncbi:hypothetical protein M405DRAFT_831557 [Rhizopogon salebrosus TDB-379]|nr:hypothetical protein M405DRAFT_831557 [Rhizopogon salebrosus TDB-379]